MKRNETGCSSHSIKKQNNIQKNKHLTVDKWKASSKMVPNYRNWPTGVFTHRLSNAIPTHRLKILRWLTNSELISFTHEFAVLKFHLMQLQIEKNYWEHINRFATPVIKWLSSMPKTITKQNYINWDYPRTTKNL